MSILREIAM